MNQNFRWSEHVRSLQVAQAELSRSTRFSSWRWCWSKGLLNLVGWEHVTRGQASKTEVYRGFDQPKWDNNIMLYIIYIIMCIYIEMLFAYADDARKFATWPEAHSSIWSGSTHGKVIWSLRSLPLARSIFTSRLRVQNLEFWGSSGWLPSAKFSREFQTSFDSPWFIQFGKKKEFHELRSKNFAWILNRRKFEFWPCKIGNLGFRFPSIVGFCRYVRRTGANFFPTTRNV
jgi:hypothetical protein